VVRPLGRGSLRQGPRSLGERGVERAGAQVRRRAGDVRSRHLDATFVLERARALARTVWSRLEGHGFRALRTVTVTVRFENFITFARSRTGREAWTSEEACARRRSSYSCLPRRPREPPHRKLRLIGVRAEKLSPDEPRGSRCRLHECSP
jgi:hypothetical protein